MKKWLQDGILIFIIILNLFFGNCQGIKNAVDTNFFENERFVGKGLKLFMCIEESGRYFFGLATTSDSVLIDCQYSHIEKINDDYFKVKKHVKSFNYRNTGIDTRNGKKYFKVKKHVKSFNYRNTGIVTRNGKKIVPCKYDYINTEGTPWIASIDDKHGMLNEKGKLVTPMKYEAIFNNYDKPRLLTLALINDSSWGYLNDKGKEVIPFKFRHSGYFNYGLAYFSYEKNIYGYMNQQGEEIIPQQFKDAQEFEGSPPLAMVMNYDGKSGFIDTTGKLIIQYLYDPYNFPDQRDFSFIEDGNKAILSIDGKYGMIDNTGNEIIPFEYTKLWPLYFENGMYIIAIKDKKGGLLNLQGDIVLPIEYRVTTLGYRSFKAMSDSNSFTIDNHGNIIIEKLE